MPIGIYLEYTAAAGRFDELLARVRLEAAQCLREDEGCLRMEVAVPQTPDGRVLLVELWRDRAALGRHAAKPGHSHAWQDELVAAKRVTVCDLIAPLVE